MGSNHDDSEMKKELKELILSKIEEDSLKNKRTIASIQMNMDDCTRKLELLEELAIQDKNNHKKKMEKLLKKLKTVESKIWRRL